MTKEESQGSWTQIPIGLNLLIGRLMNIRILKKNREFAFSILWGFLQGPQTRMPGNQWNSLQNEAARHNTHAEILGKEELEKQFPYFRFGEDKAFLEKETAGYINPRKLFRPRSG
ncbi:MAG: hypothetical protein Ct9H90mP9_6090 [Pseudomonadota bacterium]|nr:MAG: hypothetical protein Ct9H90mP9_6090 [Pseudomonadota bacterium]